MCPTPSPVMVGVNTLKFLYRETRGICEERIIGIEHVPCGVVANLTGCDSRPPSVQIMMELGALYTFRDIKSLYNPDISKNGHASPLKIDPMRAENPNLGALCLKLDRRRVPTILQLLDHASIE